MKKLIDIIRDDPSLLQSEDGMIYLRNVRESYYEQKLHVPNMTMKELIKICDYCVANNLSIKKVEIPALSRIIRVYVLQKGSKSRSHDLAMLLKHLSKCREVF